MDKKNVAFRRVHGRVIPIKLRNNIQGKEIASGVGLASAGVVTAATSGDLAARATKKAAHFKINSNIYAQKAASMFNRVARGSSKAKQAEKAGQMAFAFKIKPMPHMSKAFEKIAMKSALKSKGFVYLKKGLKGGGHALSAGLIGQGLKKVYEGASGKKADTKEEVIATAAGAGATFALSSAYTHRLLGGGRKALFRAVKIGLRIAKIKI
jgi:hypothetical protein